MTGAPNPGALPRLLQGVGERPMSSLNHHQAVHGPLPGPGDLPGGRLIDLVDQSGLRGHGGAAFPTATKLRAVAARRRPRVVVANGTEGEPPSKKDRALLREVPHLVLDGVALAARAVGARQAVIAISESDAHGLRAVTAALRERREQRWDDREPEPRIVTTPQRYLAGQESALVNLLNGGPGRPTFGALPFERGVRGRPTLVQNVETLAHMALIARHGATWFRGLGTAAHPGSTLLTVSGAVRAPGVYEIDLGMALSELLDLVGAQSPAALLIGGYYGTWLAPDAFGDVRLSGADLARHHAALGAGVVVALPREACPVAETARVTQYFWDQSAGQCGPCVHGLDAISSTVAQVAAGTATRSDLADLERWCGELPGRGACHHPDGAVRFLASALRVFAEDFHDHARHGPCPRCAHPAVLAAPPRPPVVLAA